jgi:hypothetical protein
MENVSKKERMVIHNKDVIQLYSAATPNGMKVAACLEELCGMSIEMYAYFHVYVYTYA